MGNRAVVMRAISSVLGAVLVGLSISWVSADEPAVAAIMTSRQSRAAYLAHATIWSDPGELSPDELLAGPPNAFPYSAAEALTGVDCTFLKPGRELGGKSAKFLCAPSTGTPLRPKYWDPAHETANREVFASVAATRLMWALGFNVLHALPMNIHCYACPGNPSTGEGSRDTRDYVAQISVYPPAGPAVLSRNDLNQGWSWRELDDATRALPDGPERTQQRTYFEALTLLGVFIQHGDRKPEQQVLYCEAPVDMHAGKRETLKTGDRAAVLVERPDSSACPRAAAALVDVGATFGGAGRTSNADTAKMNLDAWRRNRIFRDDDGTCHGQLTVSLAAGRDGEGDPEISEDGRRFFAEQLSRLTRAHIRAIFTAARVDELRRGTTPSSSAASSAVDEWVAAFEDKIRQIDSRRCRSVSGG